MSNNQVEIIEPGDAGHSVDVNALPLEALRGILKKLNEKSQSATRLFSKNYKLSIGDIRQLMEKVGQEFHSCTVISKSATASLILSKNERHDFRTWREFEEFDTSQVKRTSSLSVELTYDVIRNDGETPEGILFRSQFRIL